LASDRLQPDPGPPRDHIRRLRAWFRHAARGRPAVLACFVDDLTPSDERLLRALLADEDD
jgi:hypothetical protein